MELYPSLNPKVSNGLEEELAWFYHLHLYLCEVEVVPNPRKAKEE